MWLRRDEYEGKRQERRDDLVQIYVRYVQVGPRSFVAESDVPPVRVEGLALCQVRHRMEVALAAQMGAEALHLATVVEDLPEGDEEAAEEAEEA